MSDLTEYEFTARGSGYYRVFVNGAQVSQHVAEREAAQRCIKELTDVSDATVYYDHDYEVDVVPLIHVPGINVVTPPSASSDPYDLSGFDITTHTVIWPTEPTTTTTFNVPADGTFAQAVSVSGRLVNVSAGGDSADYLGATSWGDDIDIVMDNDVTITSNCNIGNASRIRWTGGKLVGGEFIGNGVSDLLINNLYAERVSGGASALRLSSSQAQCNRIALINSTFIGHGTVNTAANGTGWGLFVRPSASIPASNHENLIIANCYMTSENYQGVRITSTNKIVVVDCAFFGSVTDSQAAFRVHGESDSVFVENLICRNNTNLAHGNWNPDVTNGVWNNYHQYRPDFIPAWQQLFLHVSLNTGVVDSCVSHFGGGAGDGTAKGISPFTDNGNNTQVAWDELDSSIDYTVIPGKTALSDFGADH